MLNKIKKYIYNLRQAEVNIPFFLIRYLYYKFHRKNIRAHQNTVIRGYKNIETKGKLEIGTGFVGFLNKFDRTFINIEGKCLINNEVYIGKGCRLLVCKKAICVLEGCHVTGMTNMIVNHSLKIGEGSTVSWGCEFLDDDWHEIKYEGRKKKEAGIEIGKRVWVGSNVRILKGVHISDNSIIAAGSVVVHSFEEPNVLIAGNPAKIIKRAVSWQ